MISIYGISETPISKQLFMIREVKARISRFTERHSNAIVRGDDAKGEAEDITAYRKLLQILGREYRSSLHY